MLGFPNQDAKKPAVGFLLRGNPPPGKNSSIPFPPPFKRAEATLSAERPTGTSEANCIPGIPLFSTLLCHDFPLGTRLFRFLKKSIFFYEGTSPPLCWDSTSPATLKVPPSRLHLLGGGFKTVRDFLKLLFPLFPLHKAPCLFHS